MTSTLTLTALLETASAFARRAFRAAGALWVAFDNRREVKALGELDERMLKDIGLTHDDVQAALDAPFGTDPSVHLARLNRGRVNRHWLQAAEAEGRVSLRRDDPFDRKDSSALASRHVTLRPC